MIYYSMEWTISNKILIKYPHIRINSMWGFAVIYICNYYSISCNSARMAPIPRATLMPQPAMDP